MDKEIISLQSVDAQLSRQAVLPSHQLLLEFNGLLELFGSSGGGTCACPAGSSNGPCFPASNGSGGSTGTGKPEACKLIIEVHSQGLSGCGSHQGEF